MRSLHIMHGHRGKQQCWSGSRKKQEESLSQNLYWEFLKGKKRQSEQFRISLFEILEGFGLWGGLQLPDTWPLDGLSQ